MSTSLEPSSNDHAGAGVAAAHEIIVVPGRGLACVIGRGFESSELSGEPREWVHYADHGPRTSEGHWTWTDRVRVLTEQEAREALKRERLEAAARVVACNSPGCWCIPFLS